MATLRDTWKLMSKEQKNKLCTETRTTYPWMSNVANGNTNPSEQLKELIAAKLDSPVKELFGE